MRLKPIWLTGWSKMLDGMPNLQTYTKFTMNNIKAYHEKITKLFCRKSTAIKKNFVRGQQFTEERFIDSTSTFFKSDENLFCVKTVTGATLRE